MGLFDSLFQSKSTGVMTPEQLYVTTGQVAPASTKQPGTFLGMSKDDWRYTLGGIGSALSVPGSIGDRLGQFGMQRAQNSWGAEQQRNSDAQIEEWLSRLKSNIYDPEQGPRSQVQRISRFGDSEVAPSPSLQLRDYLNNAPQLF